MSRESDDVRSMVASSTDLEVVPGVSEVLLRAARWWTDAIYTDLLDSDVNTLEGWRVLGALRHGNGYTMSDMSAVMAIPPPTLTRIVDRLVDSGYVLRRIDATDRRRVLIHASARGKTKIRKLGKKEALLIEALAKELGEGDAKHLIESLARLGEPSVKGTTSTPT